MVAIYGDTLAGSPQFRPSGRGGPMLGADCEGEDTVFPEPVGFPREYIYNTL